MNKSAWDPWSLSCCVEILQRRVCLRLPSPSVLALRETARPGFVSPSCWLKWRNLRNLNPRPIPPAEKDCAQNRSRHFPMCSGARRQDGASTLVAGPDPSVRAAIGRCNQVHPDQATGSTPLMQDICSNSLKLGKAKRGGGGGGTSMERGLEKVEPDNDTRITSMELTG